MTTGCHLVKGLRMAYSIPTFNLTCNIWRFQPPPPGGPPALSPDCNLAVGRRVSIPTVEGDLTTAYGSMTLLLPKGTDIRDASCVASLAGDLVEVPAGSGRFYFVAYVDDVGKGFLNEHRYAYISKACQASDPTLFSYIWPAPIP